MIAIIGGQVKRFALVDVYKQAWELPDIIQANGYRYMCLAMSNKIAKKQRDIFSRVSTYFFKDWSRTRVGDIIRDHFHRQTSPEGAFLVGSPEEVAENDST